MFSTNPILTSNVYLAKFAAEASAAVKPGGFILDAGSGESPYRHLFAHANYEAADLCARSAREYPHVKYRCDLSSIPVEQERFDVVLCTQVLEHVPDPLAVLREFFRVLKPNGQLWITAPLSFEEHEIPYDYYRYTRYGWEQLLRTVGFTVERISWVQGYCGTVAYQLNLAWHHLPWRPSDFGGGIVGTAAAAFVFLTRPLLLPFAFIFSRIDLRHRYMGAGHCLDYCVVASKRPHQ
jgi:SAM-dependent methyltransferase